MSASSGKWCAKNWLADQLADKTTHKNPTNRRDCTVIVRRIHDFGADVVPLDASTAFEWEWRGEFQFFRQPVIENSMILHHPAAIWYRSAMLVGSFVAELIGGPNFGKDSRTVAPLQVIYTDVAATGGGQVIKYNTLAITGDGKASYT